jgi:hypothetical protein
MTNRALLLLSFVAVEMIATTARALDPTATSAPPNVTTAGGTSYSFLVRYEDDGEVNISSIDNNDTRVTGPSGFDVAALLVSAHYVGSASTVDATYSIVPPGGSWDSTDNGTYSVVMQAYQVFDGLGNSVKPGVIGTFQVMAPASTPTPTPRPPSQAQLLNISTRMQVQTGDNVLIGGFIVTGNAPKKVLLRAIGPSLGQHGVMGALADPVLELHAKDGSLIVSNDDWKATQQAEIEATGAAPTNDLESAIVATLDPDSYTAIVSGKALTSGIGLVEGYDLDQPADSQLANISTRGFVQTGDDVMIGGFILGNGSGTTNILVRAIGPSLGGGQGVNNALADPILELHDENGALVMSNDNWKESQEAEIEATGIPPTNDLESALIVTIPATAHTAVVSGKDGGTGVGLVEVYRLP